MNHSWTVTINLELKYYKLKACTHAYNTDFAYYQFLLVGNKWWTIQTATYAATWLQQIGNCFWNFFHLYYLHIKWPKNQRLKEHMLSKTIVGSLNIRNYSWKLKINWNFLLFPNILQVSVSLLDDNTPNFLHLHIQLANKLEKKKQLKARKSKKQKTHWNWRSYLDEGKNFENLRIDAQTLDFPQIYTDLPQIPPNPTDSLALGNESQQGRVVSSKKERYSRPDLKRQAQ